MKSRRAKKSVRSPREVDPVVEERINVSIDASVDRRRDFSAVATQQGGVLLDPDFNEQGAIDGRPRQRFKKKRN